MRSRSIGIVTILLLAPITAELLQAYLGDLGGPGVLAFTVLFFAPLYGGAALLIREVSVRTGRGWTGRLLLAAAFGVAMPTIIDVSLFTPVRDDIVGWDEIFTAAAVGGIGLTAVVTWVGGHVLMSVAAPTVVAEALAQRPGPWLRPWGIALTVVGFLAVATFIHQDQTGQFDTDAGPLTYTVAAAVVAALVCCAFTPLGRPLPPRDGSPPSVGRCLVVGLVAMACLDLMPLGWVGVVGGVAILVGVGYLVSRWARTAEWSLRHLAALTFGALLTRTLIGFLAPLPKSTTWTEKILQNVTYLVLVLVLGWAMERRTRKQQDPRQDRDSSLDEGLTHGGGGGI